MVGLVNDLDDVFVGTLTSWIDQYHHFFKATHAVNVLKKLTNSPEIWGLTLIRIQGTGTAMFFNLGEYWVFFQGNLSHRKENQANALNFQTSQRNASLMLWFGATNLAKQLSS